MERLRKCQGCGEKKPVENLIKITKLQNNTLKINPKSKEFGRSAYVCFDINCIKNLIKKNRIKSSLKYSNIQEIEEIEKKLIEIAKK